MLSMYWFVKISGIYEKEAVILRPQWAKWMNEQHTKFIMTYFEQCT